MHSEQFHQFSIVFEFFFLRCVVCQRQFLQVQTVKFQQFSQALVQTVDFQLLQAASVSFHKFRHLNRIDHSIFLEPRHHQRLYVGTDFSKDLQTTRVVLNVVQNQLFHLLKAVIGADGVFINQIATAQFQSP
uniref:(northern house mosquito) hypothetical protein n=1 Tax=Culex pipiens TaxID=7175 RepID=A0A8D8FTM4_CULPI